MQEKKLFLLDAYALIYRAYYALIRNPRFTSGGLNTSAVFGFVMTLDDLLRKENPSHLAVCFDPVGGHTFRHELFTEYKAGRDKQPEDITLSIPYIKRILAAMQIPVIEYPDYEADDVIGTLATRAEAAGFITYMMTPDKDYGQLVTDRIFMYRPALKGEGFEIRGPQQICERYGISTPCQVIDLLALEGDAADNIPGCPGVGEKTAVKLIAEFGSVENLLENTNQLKGALQKKVTENADKIRMSKFLATIKTDVPIDVNPAELVRKSTDIDALIGIYTELQFKSLIAKLKAERPIEKPAEAKPVVPSDDGPSLFDFMEPEMTDEKISYASAGANYRTLSSREEIVAEIDRACQHHTVAIAIYAEGPEAMTAKFHGLAISYETGSAVYFSKPELEVLRPLLESNGPLILSHDLKRDLIMLRREGIEVIAPKFDTSLAHYLIQPEQRHTLSDVAWDYMNYRTVDYDTAAVRAKKYPMVNSDLVQTMFCEEADLTLRLYPVLLEAMKKSGISQELIDLEQNLLPVLADMEWTGVRIDSEILASMSEKLTARAEEMELKAYEMAGHKFNVSSPSQVGQVLFGEMQIDTKVKRTKTGNFSTTEEILEKYRHSVPLVDLILRIRAIRKLLATYINALPLLVNPATGKIHTTYNQTGTATGRLSSNNPNLQNIPVRTDDGKEIRRAFIADDDCLIMSADYSQIELRLMADISGDPDMIEAFAEGEDIHRATAAKIFHEPIESVTDEQRRRAKTANFGIIYGISAFGLSERLGISRSDAKELIEGYFHTYPKIRDYMDQTVSDAREKGYVETIMGRRRMLPDINSRSAVVRGYAERNAINAPLQGSAADIIKRAMVSIYDRMKQLGLKSRMIMQVHDELIFNVVTDELPILQQLVTELMESAYHGRVALTVASGVANNWLEAH